MAVIRIECEVVCRTCGDYLSATFTEGHRGRDATMFEAGRLAAEVIAELDRATEKFGPFGNAHEGYAVLLEEVDELWQAVKHGTPDEQRKEAVQVGAMALRFLRDCCGQAACAALVGDAPEAAPPVPETQTNMPPEEARDEN